MTGCVVREKVATSLLLLNVGKIWKTGIDFWGRGVVVCGMEFERKSFDKQLEDELIAAYLRAGFDDKWAAREIYDDMAYILRAGEVMGEDCDARKCPSRKRHTREVKSQLASEFITSEALDQTKKFGSKRSAKTQEIIGIMKELCHG
jgi:hypothetical protein